MTDTLTRIRKIIDGIVAISDAAETDTLVGKLEMDSLDCVTLAMELEDEFAITGDDLDQTWDETTTVADLVRLIEERCGVVA